MRSRKHPPTVPVLPPLTSSDDSACSALDERLQTWQPVQITGTSRPRPIPSVHGPAVNGRCTPDTASERGRGSKQTLGVPRKLSSLPAVFFHSPSLSWHLFSQFPQSARRAVSTRSMWWERATCRLGDGTSGWRERRSRSFRFSQDSRTCGTHWPKDWSAERSGSSV